MSKTVPIEITGEKAAAGIPGAIFKRYSGAPHGLYYTDRDVFNDDLDAFHSGKRSLRVAAK